ncbi:MAG: UvrC, excinuclease subunit [Pseudomonadota bacterium]|jgi:excinuclease ABC subunit C
MTTDTPDIPSETPLKGMDLIKDEVTRLPDSPGVYRMMGEAGEVLYVGKAKSLKKRVTQYAQGRFHTQRIAHMVHLTRSMEFVTTKTETEALLLEINFIKSLKPRFNVLLRDDKTFPEILIRRDHASPQIRKHRGAHSIKGDYFGPFASAWAVNRTVNSLQKAFLLRSCTDSVFESRTRPCMLHQIKRCAAPCVDMIAPKDYSALVEEAHDFLSGKSRLVQKRLSQEMSQAAEDLDYERAAWLRDRLRALSAVSQDQSINPNTVEEADVFALFSEGGQACVQVFFFRAGQNWGNRAYFPRVDRQDEDEDILDAFLGQFYDSQPVPRLILASHEAPNHALLSEAFSLKSGRKVEIATPKRGEKLDLVHHALTNAREALGRRMAESSAQGKLLAAVAETFELDGPPERIEVYDNSHIMGTNAVGGMIVAGPDGFIKSQYRKFNIKDTELVPGDDYGMMREVLRRRFARMVKEESEGTPTPRPDLVLIDGGAGQLAEAMAVLAELGVEDVALVGVAKGPDRDAGLERFFLPGKTPRMLEPKSPILYYLQRLRDEAHRFAIGTHRAKRAAEMIKSPLDEIEGIGPGRKRALLHAFGSAKGVARAEVVELEKVDGVSGPLAQRIYDYFRRG